MSKSPQLGYNHNIPHRGRLYHVQTEDSGLQKAHIFTHVFYDGTIIASKKIDYDPQADVSSLDEHIVGLMQDSHKSIIRELRRGLFDEKIIRFIGEHPEAPQSGGAEATTKKAPSTPSKPAPRAPAPQPRPVESHGPALDPGPPGPNVDPTLGHPVFASSEARAQVAASVANESPQRPSRGPRRIQRRAMGGIGGSGVSEEMAKRITERRDIIVGKFASEHQAELDDEILSLLLEE